MVSHLRVLLPAAVLAAIVSVVAAPAAAPADPAAVEQGCRRNLQRLFEAFEAYRRDHDGQYPPCVSAAGLWPELLKPYLKDAATGRDALATDGPFYCPAIPAAARRASAADVSYGYNAIALGGGTRLFEPGKTRHHKRGPMHLVRQAPDPATTLLLVDCDAANKPGDGWYQAYPGTVTGRHDGKALVLFCDGHIEAVDPAKLNVGPPDTTAAPWRADLSTRRDSAPPAVQPPPVDEALPAVTAVLSAATPRIDGRVEAGEWDDATLFCGFRQYDGNVLAESDDMLAALSCSSELLSVLFIMPAGKGDLMAKAEEHDGRVWRDDAVEFLVECGRADLRYHVMANSRGVRFDAKNGKAGWDGTWTAAGTRRAPTPGLTALLGGPADDLWVMELGIPLATLGVEPPTDGTVWRFNLCRDGQQHLVFAPTFNSHDDPAKFAAVTFRRQAPVLRLLGLGQPSFGKVAIQGQVLNRGDQPTQVRIEALLEAPPVEMDQATRDLAKAKDDETLQIQVARTADVTVAPGASAPLALAEDLTDKRLNRYRVRIVARSGDAPAQVLYANDGLFNPGGPLKVVVENLPSRQCVDLVLDTGALKNRAGLRTAVVVSDDAGRERHTAMVSNDQPQMTVRVDYGAWPIGRYQVQAVLQSGDGATLAEAAAAFSRVSAPAWLDSRLGITDEVLPPWTPLEYLPGHTMRVWGREMRWGDALLPQGLHCRGVEILAEPMRVVLTAGGREARLVPEAVEVTRQDPSRAEFRTAGRAGEGLTFRAETWLEYDGLFWTTLTLHSAQPVEVSSLRLEVPLRPEVARYRLVDRDAGAVKPELERFEFAPVFTVGDAERGLSFACESQENWSLDYGRGAIEIEPREGHVVFRVNLVNKPCAFTGTRTYAFGFQPLPVKPLPPDWHSWRVGYYRSSRRGFWPKYARQTDV
ncbi:MAG: hypothetical protein GX595_10220, partial [Lentisphaerae bacterium]|nr:hypothetical protein [Lentisphaerota bacterium]